MTLPRPKNFTFNSSRQGQITHKTCRESKIQIAKFYIGKDFYLERFLIKLLKISIIITHPRTHNFVCAKRKFLFHTFQSCPFRREVSTLPFISLYALSSYIHLHTHDDDKKELSLSRSYSTGRLTKKRIEQYCH